MGLDGSKQRICQMRLAQGGKTDLETAEQNVGVGDQSGGDHQQDRGDEDEGDDELDLRRGAGCVLLNRAALIAAQGTGLAAKLAGKRRAVATGALDRSAEGRDLAARYPGAKRSQRLGEGPTAGDLGNCDPQLISERSLAGPSQLGEPRRGTATRGSANREQIEGIGEGAEKATTAQARPSLQQRIGGDETGCRHSDGNEQGDSSRRGRQDGEGGETTGRGRGKLRQQHRKKWKAIVEPGAGNAVRQTEAQRRPRRATAAPETGSQPPVQGLAKGKELAAARAGGQDGDRREHAPGTQPATCERRRMTTKPVS